MWIRTNRGITLLDREIEADVLPFCQQQGIGVLAYAPLGQGLLTGSYAGRPRFQRE